MHYNGNYRCLQITITCTLSRGSLKPEGKIQNVLTELERNSNSSENNMTEVKIVL